MMQLLKWSLLWILFAWCVHVVVWRIRIPKKQIRSILIIFASVYGIALGYSFLNVSGDFSAMLHFSIFYIASTLAYACFYSAIEEDSPSISLIQLTRVNQQCSFLDYMEIFNDDLINSRIQAMTRDGLIENREEFYHLTPKGKMWAKFFGILSMVFKFEYAG